MDWNLIKLIFLCFAVLIGISSFLLHCYENYLPIFIKKSIRHGKYAEKTRHNIAEKFEVPKRFFLHFYVFAVPLSITALVLCIHKYFFSGNLPEAVYEVLDLLLNSSRKPLVTPLDTMIAITLITVQCCKRLYEACYVSVYSEAKMSVSLYIVGFIHYFGTITCIIGESYGFIKGSEYSFHWNELNSIHIIFSICFLLASYEQLRTNFILASLRKNKKGEVVTKSYKIPSGRLFEYVTAPLQLTEIVMYCSLNIILRQNSSFCYIFIWVLANQVNLCFAKPDHA
ncbi:polyprenol reductase isoform X2 [Cotesia glomerata]|uniref:polyprenol reductase isoform X2 n=1 Tax=Cotesia glomerata TaxID=32391 RepID=UPI001D01058E|nr:polyprenol reductase isoform X2 [Cotesia glomerata]